MSFRNIDEICEFLISQATYIGDKILVPNQPTAKVRIDKRKPLPEGATPIITQAHCSIDDIAQEHFLKDLIQRSPNSRIVVEEITPTTKKFPEQSEDCYYGDLLDGTYLYCKNSPIFGISLGYAYKDEMQVGVVYFPKLKLLFYTIKGGGAYLNRKKIKIHQPNKVEKGDKIILNSKISEEVEEQLKKEGLKIERPFCSIYSISLVVRNLAKAYLAKFPTVWDVLPSTFIVEEAGGTVMRFDGSKPDYYKRRIIEDFIVAPNKDYASNLLRIAGLLRP